MIKSKIKQNLSYLKKLSFRSDISIDSSELRDAREYIAKYWNKLERFHPKDDESLLGLPNPYLVPSYSKHISFDFNEMYYWDSYFRHLSRIPTELVIVKAP